MRNSELLTVISWWCAHYLAHVNICMCGTLVCVWLECLTCAGGVWECGGKETRSCSCLWVSHDWIAKLWDTIVYGGTQMDFSLEIVTARGMSNASFTMSNWHFACLAGVLSKKLVFLVTPKMHFGTSVWQVSGLCHFSDNKIALCLCKTPWNGQNAWNKFGRPGVHR